jgi:hypothetical protein
VTDRSDRPLTRFSLIAGWLLHAAAVLLLWRVWEPGLRGLWLIYVDLPVSLLWLGASGRIVLALSLLVGGLWWGTLTFLAERLVGRLSSRRRGG